MVCHGEAAERPRAESLTVFYLHAAAARLGYRSGPWIFPNYWGIR